MPALNSAREKARTTSCLNNLRQLFNAAALYSNDYATERIAGSGNGGNWVNLMTEAGGYLPVISYSNDNLRSPLSGAFKCPSVANVAQPAAIMYGFLKSHYGLNKYLYYNASNPTGNGADVWHPNKEIKNPARTVYFGDTKNGADTTLGEVGAFIFRHERNGSANYLFLEGHGESRKVNAVPTVQMYEASLCQGTIFWRKADRSVWSDF